MVFHIRFLVIVMEEPGEGYKMVMSYVKMLISQTFTLLYLETFLEIIPLTSISTLFWGRSFRLILSKIHVTDFPSIVNRYNAE